MVTDRGASPTGKLSVAGQKRGQSCACSIDNGKKTVKMIIKMIVELLYGDIVTSLELKFLKVVPVTLPVLYLHMRIFFKRCKAELKICFVL
jgi:hypothetical protein